MRRLSKVSDQGFGVAPLVAVPLPGRAMPVAGLTSARGVAARPSRAFSLHEQRGLGVTCVPRVGPYRRRAWPAAQMCPPSTSLLSVPAAAPPAAGTCGGLA
jgi:hypothetical protein